MAYFLLSGIIRLIQNVFQQFHDGVLLAFDRRRIGNDKLTPQNTVVNKSLFGEEKFCTLLIETVEFYGFRINCERCRHAYIAVFVKKIGFHMRGKFEGTHVGIFA